MSVDFVKSPEPYTFVPSNCLFFNDLSLKFYLGKINQKFSKTLDRVRGWSCEPNKQHNVCTTSVTEGEVGPVKLV